MSRRHVRVLPGGVIDRIAAGEVVERPASVVKELIDNALDANASRIEVTLEGAGRKRITVADDGHGMDREDARAAFERHATSKIEGPRDLDRIATLGFRGEALPSIAAVSRIVLETAPEEGGEGTRVRIEGGGEPSLERIARGPGTTVDVRELFFNTPARKAFLKTHATEQAHVVQGLVEAALSRSDVAWLARHGKREILSLAGARTTEERIAALYDPAYVDTLLPVAAEVEGVQVRGATQRAAAATASRRRQFVFVNGRAVDAPDLLRAVLRGYRSTLPAGARPDTFLFVTLDADRVDVNVHPAKREVRFRDPAVVAGAVEEAVRAALGAGPAAARPYRAGAGRVAERGPRRSGEDGRSAASGRERAGRPEAPVSTERSGRQLGLFAAHRARSAGETDRESPEEADDRPIGPSLWQLHDRFILASTGSGLAIIDQHSAHERVLYEEVIDGLREGSREAQRLLFPVVLELTPLQHATWEEFGGLIERLGFEFESFGGRSIAVSAVPAFRHRFDPEEALAGLLDDLGEPGRGSADMNQHERVARLFACKAAIKAGQPLATGEMTELIDRLFATRLPYDDVHGRPAVLQLSMDDLERHFGRH